MDNPNSGYSCADPWETHLHCEWMRSHFEDCDWVELPHIGTIGIGSLVLDLHAAFLVTPYSGQKTPAGWPGLN